jgi:hypothetical protein
MAPEEVKVDPDLYDLADAKAKTLGLTVDEVVAELLRGYVKRLTEDSADS